MALRGGKPSTRGTTPSDISLDQQVAIVKQAASSHQIPFWVLWGIYGAESTWGRNGTNWFGLVDVPRSGNFKGDANISAATVKRLLKNSTLEKALRAYSGNSYGVEHVQSLGNINTTKGSGTTPGKAAAKAVHDVTHLGITDAIKAIGNLVSTVLNPAEWGKLLANTIATVLRFLLKALYQYTVLPPWHWTERAVNYYWDNNMAATGPTDISDAADRRWDRSLFTVAFWGLGYFLLWGKADDDEVALSGNKVSHTVLGRNAQTFLSYKKGRGLKKGKKEIDKATPPKPTPKPSSASVNQIRTVSALRRRTVNVKPVVSSAVEPDNVVPIRTETP